MSEGPQRRLAAILAADVVGYSRLMEADEAGTLATMKAHRAKLWEPMTEQYGGRIVGTAGDSLLVEFQSAVAAVQCAVAVQQGMTERNADLQERQRMQLRIGVNIGEVIVDGEDIYGDGVNVAARLETLCEAGGVAISGNVHEQVRGKLDERFADAGEHEVKNIVRPIQVWRWAEIASAEQNVTDGEPLLLPDKPSIVILPFNNMSGDPEQEYFADGTTEDITTELSRFGELFVIARNTAFTYKDRKLNVREIAQELGVHFVLEGSVRRVGNRVRINAQLIDGQNGSHLWAERYDGSIEEIFDLQDQVTHQVVSAAVPHINEAALARIRRGDRVFDEAHDLAWRAWDNFQDTFRSPHSSSMQAAKAKAYQAIELNERCLNAYSTICMATWSELLRQWSDDVDESMAELKQAAETFVSLSPNSHMAHFCHGLSNMIADRSEAARQDFRHSVALNPNDAMVLSTLACNEALLGDLEEAKAIAAKAIRLNPKDSWAGTAYLALSLVAFVEDDSGFRHWAEKAILAQPYAPIRRALMIAHAAEVGDQALLEEHLEHLNKFAPRFLPRLLSGERETFRVPQHREKFLTSLRKAESSE